MLRRCEYCGTLLAHWRRPNAKYCDKYCRGYARNERIRLRLGVNRKAENCLACGFPLTDRDMRVLYCDTECQADYKLYGGPRPPCVICGESMGREQHRRSRAHKGSCRVRWWHETKSVARMVRGWRKYHNQLERNCVSCKVRFTALRNTYLTCSLVVDGMCERTRERNKSGRIKDGKQSVAIG